MAVILSIESSTKTSSIAIHENGILISSINIHLDKSHAEYLTPSIKYLLEVSGQKMNSIDAVAISKGPGSYTGLRIGTSTAKGICYALDAKLLAVNTLQAMVHGMTTVQYDHALLCPMIDARRMEVYCLLADHNGQLLEKTHAKIIDEASFNEYLAKQKIVFFGNGAAKCKEALGHEKNAIFLDDIHPSAAHIGALAWVEYQENKFEDLAYFEPFYLKDFIAKKPSANKLV